MHEGGEVIRRIPLALRRLVEDRAGQRCEYCHLPRNSRLFRFPVDHVIAIKHGGASDPSNLASACLTCNVHKGSDIAALDPLTGKLTALYHPRRQIWREHLDLDQTAGYIRGKTPEGRATAALLKMDSWERREERLRLVQVGLLP